MNLPSGISKSGFALAATVVAAASACANGLPMYEVMTDNKPDVGVVTTVYLGDKMLDQRHGQYEECIVPKFSAKKRYNLGVGQFEVKAGEPMCKASAAARYYTPNYQNNSAGGKATSFETALIDGKNGNIRVCMVSMGVKLPCTDDQPKDTVTAGPWFLYEANSLQQTIEYNGRNGSVLKFVYSETSDGVARAPFTREFEIDLSQGKIAAYKGAVIEIEDATNANVTYKVIRNFQS